MNVSTGSCEVNKGSKASEKFEQALALAQKLGNLKQTWRACFSLSNLRGRQGQHEESNVLLDQCSAIAEDEKYISVRDPLRLKADHGMTNLGMAQNYKARVHLPVCMHAWYRHTHTHTHTHTHILCLSQYVILSCCTLTLPRPPSASFSRRDARDQMLGKYEKTIDLLYTALCFFEELGDLSSVNSCLADIGTCKRLLGAILLLLSHPSFFGSMRAL